MAATAVTPIFGSVRCATQEPPRASRSDPRCPAVTYNFSAASAMAACSSALHAETRPQAAKSVSPNPFHEKAIESQAGRLGGRPDLTSREPRFHPHSRGATLGPVHAGFRPGRGAAISLSASKAKGLVAVAPDRLGLVVLCNTSQVRSVRFLDFLLRTELPPPPGLWKGRKPGGRLAGFRAFHRPLGSFSALRPSREEPPFRERSRAAARSAAG
jgi:hypothetical protein